MIALYEEKDKRRSLGSPRQYGLEQNHKHLAEMKAVTGIDFAPAFHPIVADYFSGMLGNHIFIRQIDGEKTETGRASEGI